MKLATKERLVLALLALVAAWIPGHALVVARFDLNPWKWFGWAMYTVPPPVIRCYPVAMPEQRMLEPDGLPPATRERVLATTRAFLQARADVGAWIEPDECAEAFFEAFPGVDVLAIQVQRLEVRRESATLERIAVDQYDYRRGGTGGD